MSRQSNMKADCYSAGERTVMVWGQQLRGRLFAPLVRALTACRVTPNQLTLLSMLVGLAFCPRWFWSPTAALAALAAHVLLDSLDGPLARKRNLASRQGSFTDGVADQVVVVASTVTLMAAQIIHVTAGGFYIFFYTVVVLFAMVRNALEIPYPWLVRPRLFVYGWLLVEMFFWPGSLGYILWMCNVPLALAAASGFLAIRRKMP